jgi:hypothetical protein
MKLVSGGTLADRRLPPPQAIEVIATVAEAVHYAHERGMVHRDLKPANLMLDDDGHVWVMDFGLARPLHSGATLTVAGNAVGTPAYMSPEQARGERCDVRSDVYSLGATLYDLLTGRPPFEGSTAVEVMMAVVNREASSVRTHEPRLPREVEDIVAKALEKRPAARYRSARALGDDLRRHLRGESIEARPPSPAARLLKWVARHPVASVAASIALAALGLLLAGAIFYVVNVTRARDQAQRQRIAAELKLAQSLVSQGDALGLAGRWLEAQARFGEARAVFAKVGASPLPAELGLMVAYQHAPPALQSYVGQEKRLTAAAFTPMAGARSRPARTARSSCGR